MEVPDKLLFIDQHAAHERMLFDKYMRQIQSSKASQVLLVPQMVRLSASEIVAVEELMPVLEASGFDISIFDANNIAIRAIPVLFGEEASPKELLLEAIDEWDGVRKQVSLDRMYRRISQMACKHAIKGGDKLSETEIRQFMTECLESNSMPTCPHGRPIVIEVPKTTL